MERLPYIATAMPDRQSKSPQICKILTSAEWLDFQAAGEFTGSALDRTDGFIHLSGADQVAGTLATHFADAKGRLPSGLVVAHITPDTLGMHIRWEASRGGTKFPHLYDIAIPLEAVTHACPACDWPCCD